MQNHFRDLRRQEAQAHDSGEVGSADAYVRGNFGHGLVVMSGLQDPAVAARLPDQPDEAAIGRALDWAGVPLDEQFGFHAGALEASRHLHLSCRPVDPARQAAEVERGRCDDKPSRLQRSFRYSLAYRSRAGATR